MAGGMPGRGVCMVGGGWACVSCVAGKTAIAAGGTHSTGMHSCYVISFQISVLSGLPVGENPQDHVFVDHPIFETKDPIGVVIGGGYAWQGGVHGGGWVGMRFVRGRKNGNCSGRYAFYWNAFLLRYFISDFSIIRSTSWRKPPGSCVC